MNLISSHKSLQRLVGKTGLIYRPITAQEVMLQQNAAKTRRPFNYKFSNKMVSFTLLRAKFHQFFLLCVVFHLGAGVEPDQRPGSSKGRKEPRKEHLEPRRETPREPRPRVVRADQMVIQAAEPYVPTPPPVDTATGRIYNTDPKGNHQVNPNKT